jgi:hypothetical protein
MVQNLCLHYFDPKNYFENNILHLYKYLSHHKYQSNQICLERHLLSSNPPKEQTKYLLQELG